MRKSLIRHDETGKITYLNWGDYELEAAWQPEFAAGAEVDWLIPAENLILHRRDRPSRGERENPITGTISEFIPLGETSSVTIDFNNEQTMAMAVPTHVARRNGLARGETVTVSLLSEGIHLMAKPPSGRNGP